MAKTIIEPYLFFGGRCEEAIEFYTKALGAELEMKMLFSDSPEPFPEGVIQPGFENKVMHASLWVEGNRIMLCDGVDADSGFKGFSLSIAYPERSSVENAFNALAEGGSVQMPLGKTFWSPLYGMVTDRFGVGWMLSIAEDSV